MAGYWKINLQLLDATNTVLKNRFCCRSCETVSTSNKVLALPTKEGQCILTFLNFMMKNT
jgi:hypothetical protein